MNNQRKHRDVLPDWPHDFIASRPTDVSPRTVLHAHRPPLDVTSFAARMRALVRIVCIVLYVGLVTLAALALYAHVNKAHAAPATWLAVNLGSYHPDRAYAREHDLTAFNPGLGIEYALRDDVRLVGGGYRNSYRRASFYAGATWQPIEILGARFGVLGGAVNGYPIHNGRIGPFGGLAASVEIGRAGINLIGLPKVRDKAHGAIALQLKWAL